VRDLIVVSVASLMSAALLTGLANLFIVWKQRLKSAGVESESPGTILQVYQDPMRPGLVGAYTVAVYAAVAIYLIVQPAPAFAQIPNISCERARLVGSFASAMPTDAWPL
jgi:hypothetical protein